MGVNVAKIRGKIAEKGFTIEGIAESLSIHPATFHRKIKGGGLKFSLEEADALKALLKLSQKEAAEIFFSEELA
jgi:hypothetical protein